jgi:hypothetical protein
MRRTFAALAILGLAAATPAFANKTWTAPNGAFSINVPDGWAVDVERNDDRMLIAIAGGPAAECTYRYTTRPNTVGNKADAQRRGMREQAISDKNWRDFLAGTVASREPLSLDIGIVEEVGTWPVQTRTGTSEGSPIFLAYHLRPGFDVFVSCISYEGNDPVATMKAAGVSVTAPQDATEWAPAAPPAPAEPTVNVPKG